MTKGWIMMTFGTITMFLRRYRC